MDTSFPGITDKSLKSVATKVSASTDEFKTKKLLLAATKDDDARAGELGWHLLAAQLVPPKNSAALLSALQSDGMSVSKAATLADLMVRTPEDVKGDFWPGWTYALDALAYQGYGLSPAAFDGRFAELPRAMRLGVILVRARREQRPSPAAGLEVMAALAQGQATGYGITTNVSMPFFRNGVEVAHDLADCAALTTIALLLGQESDWDQAMLEATRARTWGLIENVSSSLERMPLAELAAHFVAREDANQRVFGDSSTAKESVRALLARRKDDRDALAEAARSCPDLEPFLAAD